MKIKEILKEIKKINPLLRIEESDSRYWLKCCEKNLNESYSEYLQAVKRVLKNEKKLEEAGLQIKERFIEK